MPRASDSSESPGASKFRIKNLVTAADWIEGEISACTRLGLAFSDDSTRSDPRWATAQARIHRILSQVDGLCRKEGISPLSLPTPSRRAYQWLTFLSQADHLLLHASTLSQLMAVDRRPQVRLYHIGGWWRVWRHGSDIRLTVSEAFVAAPRPVLTALVKLGLPYSRKRIHRRMIEDYAETPSFQAMLARLEGTEAEVAFVTKGRCHELEEVFLRVKSEYFDGELERPKMRWSKSVNRGEFGHYQPSTDTITINRALDAPGVPLFAMDFVMFHELLHKQLGTRKVNGRRRVHTREFRTAERRFTRFSDASAYLAELSRAIRTRKR